MSLGASLCFAAYLLTTEEARNHLGFLYTFLAFCLGGARPFCMPSILRQACIYWFRIRRPELCVKGLGLGTQLLGCLALT